MGRSQQRNNVKISGSGTQTLVFAHGLGADQTFWRLVAPHFEREFRVVLFDHVGSGGSDRTAYDPARYTNLSDYARDVLEICTDAELEDVVFVGHSVSGMIGVLAAIEQPSLFARLVLLASSPRYINEPPSYIGGFEASDIENLMTLMDNNFLTWATTFAEVAIKEPAYAEEFRNSFCATDPSSLRDFASLTLYCDLRRRLSEVRVPTLVVQCTQDDIVPVSVGEFIHHQIAGSEYRLIDVPGHCPQLTHPRDVTSVIERYLVRRLY